MKIGLIKWFYKGDTLHNKVSDSFIGVNISNLSKDDIEKKASAIYDKNKSLFPCFEDSKRSAIRSTIKEFIREHKTFAIANLLVLNKKSLEETQSKGTEEEKEKELESLAETINSEKNKYAAQYGGLLNHEEIKLVVRNFSKFTDYLKENNAIDKSGKVNRDDEYFRETGKPMMREIEKKVPMKIPENLLPEYDKWRSRMSYPGCNDKNIGTWFQGIDIRDFPAFLANDLKINLFSGMNRRKLDLINTAVAASNLKEPMYYKQELDKFATSTKQDEARKPIQELANNKPDLDTSEKVKLLQKVAKNNRKVLACFTEAEIRTMNLLFKAELPNK